MPTVYSPEGVFLFEDNGQPSIDDMRYALMKSNQQPSIPASVQYNPLMIAKALREDAPRIAWNMGAPLLSTWSGVLGNIQRAGAAKAYEALGMPEDAKRMAPREVTPFNYQLPLTTPLGEQTQEGIGQVADVLKAPHMWPISAPHPNARPAFTPNDLRVLGAEATNLGRQVKNVPSDFLNAQSGAVRIDPATGKPTLGATLQSAAESVARHVEQRQAAGLSPLPGVPSVLTPQTSMHMVKSKGGAPGNWITSLGRPLEDYPGMLGTHINEKSSYLDTPEALAWNQWLRNPYLKYITNEMGSGAQTDSLVRLGEKEGIHVGAQVDPASADELQYTADSNRNLWATNAATPTGKQTATTPLGQLVENATDSSVLINDKSHVNPADFPFVNKLQDNQPIYDLERFGLGLEVSGLNDIRRHARSMIFGGKIKPEDVGKFTVEQAARDLWAQNNSEIAKANRDPELYKTWKAERQQTIPAAMTFEDGSKMVLFDRTYPKDMLRRDLSVDTKDLNHCVVSAARSTREYPDRHVPVVEPHTGQVPNDLRGREVSDRFGYINNIENGDQEIASLRDPQGNAVATIDIDPTPFGRTKWSIEQISGNENKEVDPRWTPKIQKFLNDNADKISHISSDGLKNADLFSTINKQSIYGLLDVKGLDHNVWSDYLDDMQRSKVMDLESETLSLIAAKTGKTVDQLNPTGDVNFWEEWNDNGVEELQKRFEEMGISPNDAIPFSYWYQKQARPISNGNVATLLEGEVPHFFTKKQIEEAVSTWGYKLFPTVNKDIELHDNALHDLRIARHQLYMNPGAATPQQIQELRDLSNNYYRLADAIQSDNKMPTATFDEVRKQVLSLLVNAKDFDDLRRAEKYVHEMHHDAMDPYQYSMLQAAIEMKEQSLLDSRARGYKDGGVVKEQAEPLTQYEFMKLLRWVQEQPQFQTPSNVYEDTNPYFEKDPNIGMPPSQSLKDTNLIMPWDAEPIGSFIYKDEPYIKSNKSEKPSIEQMKYELMMRRT